MAPVQRTDFFPENLLTVTIYLKPRARSPWPTIIQSHTQKHFNPAHFSTDAKTYNMKHQTKLENNNPGSSSQTAQRAAKNHDEQKETSRNPTNTNRQQTSL